MNAAKLAAACALLVAAAPAVARAKPSGDGHAASHKDHVGNQGSRGSKKKRHHDPVITGGLVPLGRLRSEPLPRPSGELVLESVNHAGETLHVNLYTADGAFDEEALDQLNHFWRCRRTGTEKPIDPHLFEVLSVIHDHYGKPIQLVSGFRNQEHTSSFHFHGSASDIRIAGVDEKVLHDYVTTLDVGGMGIGRYPRAKFVHVDVRPEPSYRWTDRSPPGGDGGNHSSHKKKSKSKSHNA